MGDTQMTAPLADSLWWARDRATLSASPASSRGRTGGSVAFGALVLFVCILILNPQAWFPALKPLRIALLTSGVAASSLLLERWRDRKPLGFSSEMLICWLLVAWSFMTLPLSYWPAGSLATLTDAYMKAVMLFWLLANVITTEHRLRVIRAVLIVCSVPVAGTALSNFFAGRFLPDDKVVARITGYGQGLSANLNDLALMLNLLLPLTIALFLSTTSKLVRSFCIAVITINILGIIVTFSRGGFLGLATIAAVYVLQMIRRRGADRAWAFAVVAAAALAVPLLPSEYMDRLATVKSVDADPTGSSQARWRDTVAAAQFVTQHPIIGAGIGMDFLALNQIRGNKWLKVHNVYLEYAVDLGVPGLALFLTLLVRVFKGVRLARKRLEGVPSQRQLFLLVEALETSLIVFAICGFFHPIAYDLFFYFIGGLALAAGAVTQQTLSATPTRS